MKLREMILRLASASGPSGFESGARAVAEELLAPLVDEVRTDVMGNLIGLRRCKKENAPTVMLDAHLDEIGLIVTGYEKGFLRFSTIGGVDARMLPALEVKLLTEEPMYGVIDVLPPHVLSAEDQEKPLDVDKLFIDVGLDEESVKAAVPLGTPVVFSVPVTALGEHQICGKSLDDRSCAAILLKVMEKTQDKKLPVNVAVCLASQEEVGCRGAVTAAFSIAPEAAIAVDVTHGHTPDAPKHKTVPMNSGPAIGVGPNMTRAVSDKLAALCREREIPYQTEVSPAHSGTDAWPIQISREGVATGVVSLPLKYMHTPVEVLDIRDAKAIVELLCAWLETYGKED